MLLAISMSFCELLVCVTPYFLLRTLLVFLVDLKTLSKLTLCCVANNFPRFFFFNFLFGILPLKFFYVVKVTPLLYVLWVLVFVFFLTGILFLRLEKSSLIFLGFL